MSAFDPLDERFRWCIFCKADCWPDREYQEHAEDCPSATNLWPVTGADLAYGLACIDCHVELNLGDFYAQVDVTEPGEEIRCFEVVCIGCKAAHDLLGADRP
jgi:hypothetical protein